MTEIVNSDKKTRQINYLSKDFDAYRNDLIEYIKRYYPDTWQDFTNVNPGMVLLELLAYLGDTISYNMDRQINECFIDRAQEEKNIISLAQNYGYKPSFTSPSNVELTFSATFIDSISSSTVFKIKKGAKVESNLGRNVVFETIDQVDFSSPKNRRVESSGGGQTRYSVSGVKAIAGTSRTFSFDAPSIPIPFYQISIPDTSITEITSVSSSDGYVWYEVDNLSQETIFYGNENKTSSSGEVSHILKYKKIPRRFVVNVLENGGKSITFGSGVSESDDYNIIPNPEDFVLPPTLRGSVEGFTPSNIDSSNFLRTNTLGIAPSNIRFDINYRVGGGFETNVSSSSIRKILKREIEFNDPTAITTYQSQINDQLISITCTNPLPASGGTDRESLDSIKQNSIASFNSQGRVVTLQDYQVRSMSMPSEFGKPFRVFAKKDLTKSLGVELTTIGINSQGKLTKLNDVIKNNLETYISYFKSFSDTVTINDGYIANIGVEFSIVPNPNFDQIECLVEGINIIRRMLRTSITNFNDSLIVSNFILDLQSSAKILSVSNFKFVSYNGTIENKEYSTYEFDVISNSKNGILKFPENVIWEVKYPNSDIVGNIT